MKNLKSVIKFTTIYTVVLTVIVFIICIKNPVIIGLDIYGGLLLGIFGLLYNILLAVLPFKLGFKYQQLKIRELITALIMAFITHKLVGYALNFIFVHIIYKYIAPPLFEMTTYNLYRDLAGFNLLERYYLGFFRSEYPPYSSSTLINLLLAISIQFIIFLLLGLVAKARQVKIA